MNTVNATTTESKTHFNGFGEPPVEYFSSILTPIPRVIFDPANEEHRQAFLDFETTGKWSILFYVEWPCTSVPYTAMKKLAMYACNADIKGRPLKS